jgi:hypothetical protein
VFATLQSEYDLFRPQRVPARYDHDRAKIWIDHCTEFHAICGDQEPVVEGIRLIDCRTGEVVKAEPASRWIALSYVWGDDASTEPIPRPPER